MARLRALEIRHVSLPLKSRIKHASHDRRSSDNIIVRATLDDGSVGYGEGVPRSYVTGETVESVFSAISLYDFGTILGDPKSPEEVVRRLEAWPDPVEVGGEVSDRSARCACELALLDAYARSFDVGLGDVVRLVEDASEFLTDRPTWVRYSGAITAESRARECVSAWKMKLYGFAHVKIKVGVAGQDDVARLGHIRRILGQNVDLRMDANEAWSPEELAEKLSPLLKYQPSLIEQPVPHERLEDLAKLRPSLGISVMLDESLRSPADAWRSVELGAADLFNIRLSKCGGILPSIRILKIAARHGIGVQLGCHPGETAILSAAGRHFASNLRGLRYLEGSYDRHILVDNVTTRNVSFTYGGRAWPLRGPGLGIAVDPRKLDRLTSRKIEIRHD